jgi:hypothetical protein
MIRLDSGSASMGVKQALRQAIDTYYDHAPNKTLQVVFDVDPRN